ncbi:hypothetical protein [Sphingomonas sp. HMP6]|uniref:hypothetical protein n=1 Tax=Sphingomonas sp. HMP6 TaxID=1517551 RepID=UPI001596ED97|nr:hypothetical protein [Sphingomonas sp. HMP6]BCA57696.1 hypothetical protein HMP06_0465 [Sphingomonas sp. HMP6]
MSQDAATIRAQPISAFFSTAEAVADSEPVIAIYAAPEWYELGEDGKAWIAGIIRETLARAAEQL